MTKTVSAFISISHSRCCCQLCKVIIANTFHIRSVFFVYMGH